MKYGIKTAAQAALLAVGIVMVCLGVYRHCFSFLLSSSDISIVEKKAFLFELQNAYD